MKTTVKAKQIAELNDNFRKTGMGGRIVFTEGILAYPAHEQQAIWQMVREFDSFPEGDDPYKEHDFGAFQYRGKKFLFKIDYYDKDLTFGSEDPADPTQTARVLTVMLAEEY